MTKERTSNERFEIVGLTKAEVDRCMEVLCGGPMPWDRGYCFASSELFARPSRYGPCCCRRARERREGVPLRSLLRVRAVRERIAASRCSFVWGWALIAALFVETGTRRRKPSRS